MNPYSMKSKSKKPPKLTSAEIKGMVQERLQEQEILNDRIRLRAAVKEFEERFQPRKRNR